MSIAQVLQRNNCENHGIICVILSVITYLPLIKTFCILLSKLRGRLFTIFTAYIVSVFLVCFDNNWLDCRRVRVH